MLPKGLGQLTQVGVMSSSLRVNAYLFHAESFMCSSEFSAMIAGEEECFDVRVMKGGEQSLAQGQILVDKIIFGLRLAGSQIGEQIGQVVHKMAIAETPGIKKDRACHAVAQNNIGCGQFAMDK